MGNLTVIQKRWETIGLTYWPYYSLAAPSLSPSVHHPLNGNTVIQIWAAIPSFKNYPGQYRQNAGSGQIQAKRMQNTGKLHAKYMQATQRHTYKNKLLGLRPGSPPGQRNGRKPKEIQRFLRGELCIWNVYGIYMESIWNVYTALPTAEEARVPKTLLFPYLFGYAPHSPLQTSPLSSLEKKQSLTLKNAWRRINFPTPGRAPESRILIIYLESDEIH